MNGAKTIRFFLSVLFAGFFTCCSGAQSSVPFAYPGNTAVRLYALNSSAKDGLLEGTASSAWFLVKSGKQVVSGAIEIEVLNPASNPVTISLGLLATDDLTSGGTLVKNPASRNLSTVENASGLLRIRMNLPQTPPGAAFAGFAVQLDAGSALKGGEEARVQITAASIENAETGWQKTDSFLWTGFTSGGGVLDAANINAGLSSTGASVLPQDSVLTFFFAAANDLDLSIGHQGQTVFSAGTESFAFRKTKDPYTTSIPSLIFSKTPVTVLPASGGENLAGMRVILQKKFPVIDTDNPSSPISADPHMIIEWKQEAWRNKSCEIFSWDRFPSILIFDTEDYAVQDRFFKRLAFYAEKQGFKGKLSTDGEIAELHAFNAHDYRAESLAGFFELARSENFPLNAEETELRGILLSEGIIKQDGASYASGAGAVLSISRESPSYLRYMFIAHEGYHGIYFIDPDFRAKVAEVYHSMDARAIGFLESYFTVVGSLGYDSTDQYLMENEFMGYIMQQSADKVAPYFTGTISPRFVRYGGKLSLSDYIMETKASEFTRAAKELNDYVFARWGIEGGRTGLYIPD